jgi:SPP1 family phage portal protein
MSDKANTVEATLDQYLLLQGCDTDEDEVIKMLKARALFLKGSKNESAASFITPTQQDQAVENYLNRVKDTIYDLAFIPRLNDLSGATATEIKIKYSNLDMKASKKESYFIQAIDRFLQIVTNLLTTVNNKPYNAEWIKLTLNRNLPQNNKETADIVAELVDKVPDQYLFELLWFIKDPRKALEEMRAQKKEAAKTSIAAMGFDGEFVDTTTNDEGQTTNTNKDEKSTKNE